MNTQLTINDFKIDIKKNQGYQIIVNVTVMDMIELRGFRVRKSRYGKGEWWVAPPATPSKMGKYFWIVAFKDSALWEELRQRIISLVEKNVQLDEVITDEDLDEIDKAIT